DRIAFDGTRIGTFAAHAESGQLGFTEATAIVVVPRSIACVTGGVNNDGVVNAADYVVWRKSSPTTTLPNDDTPGVVDASDYANWRGNFGKDGATRGARVAAT